MSSYTFQGGDIQARKALKKLQEIRNLESENDRLRVEAKKAQERFRSHSQKLRPKRDALYDEMEVMLK